MGTITSELSLVGTLAWELSVGNFRLEPSFGLSLVDLSVVGEMVGRTRGIALAAVVALTLRRRR